MNRHIKALLEAISVFLMLIIGTIGLTYIGLFMESKTKVILTIIIVCLVILTSLYLFFLESENKNDTRSL